MIHDRLDIRLESVDVDQTDFSPRTEKTSFVDQSIGPMMNGVVPGSISSRFGLTERLLSDHIVLETGERQTCSDQNADNLA